MRVTAHQRFDRELYESPAEVHAWAMDWMESVKASGADFRQVIADASPLKGRNARDHYVRKWRRKKPHGEYRLVFRATKEEAHFVWIGPRSDNYKIALRRIRAM